MGLRRYDERLVELPLFSSLRRPAPQDIGCARVRVRAAVPPDPPSFSRACFFLRITSKSIDIIKSME